MLIIHIKTGINKELYQLSTSSLIKYLKTPLLTPALELLQIIINYVMNYASPLKEFFRVAKFKLSYRENISDADPANMPPISKYN